jgi:hypothetical protein
MGFMKRTMQKGLLRIPYDSELINEINVERYEQTQTGQTKFSHPNRTHDDRLWALSLAIYASGPDALRFVPFAAFGHVSKPRWAVLRTEVSARELSEPLQPCTILRDMR